MIWIAEIMTESHNYDNAKIYLFNGLLSHNYEIKSQNYGLLIHSY